MASAEWSGEKMKVHDIRLILAVTLAASFFLLAGCAAKPDESAVKDTIRRYFQEKHYKVVEMDIASVSSIPLKSRVYMGPEGYIVHVRSMTLEAAEDSGPPLNYRKGQRITFNNALVHIRAGEKGGWQVSNISGITVI
jgi:hypothetical protein